MSSPRISGCVAGVCGLVRGPNPRQSPGLRQPQLVDPRWQFIGKDGEEGVGDETYAAITRVSVLAAAWTASKSRTWGLGPKEAGHALLEILTEELREICLGFRERGPGQRGGGAGASRGAERWASRFPRLRSLSLYGGGLSAAGGEVLCGLVRGVYPTSP